MPDKRPGGSWAPMELIETLHVTMELAESKLKKTASILEKGKEEAIERHLSALKVITSEVDQCKRTVEELQLADKTELEDEAIAEFGPGHLLTRKSKRRTTK